jgi:hypothetical protein
MTLLVTILGIYVVGFIWTRLLYRGHDPRFAWKAAFLWPEGIYLILKVIYQAVKYKIWQ